MEIPAILTFDPDWFPDPNLAMTDPNGLLAVGGDLSPHRLLTAYRQGIFPWSSDPNMLLWWSPDPRAIIYPDKIKLSASLKKLIKQQKVTISFDQACPEVIVACSLPRESEPETWITPEMIQSYQMLHELGHVHSIEVWDSSALIGGLYGVDCGGFFAGESMFSLQSNASKIALAYLAWFCRENHIGFIDCQIPNMHLSSMGAVEIPRSEFLAKCQGKADTTPRNIWNLEWNQLQEIDVILN